MTKDKNTFFAGLFRFASSSSNVTAPSLRFFALFPSFYIRAHNNYSQFIYHRFFLLLPKKFFFLSFRGSIKVEAWGSRMRMGENKKSKSGGGENLFPMRW